MEDIESIRAVVCERIEQVETAMKSLQGLRKTLLHKAYEAKQSILSKFISERDSMQCKEMSLLIEVDKLLHSKDDVLVTQLGKLSQVLGCLRNCQQSPHPCGDCLEKFEDIDMLSMDEVSLEFSVANERLKDSVRDYLEPFDSTLSHTPSMYMKEDADNMTKWLLTPSNNHVTVEGEPMADQPFLSAEWLVQHHMYSSRTGTETADVFAIIKSEGGDNWLTSDRPVSMTDRPAQSLYVTVFNSVACQDAQDWLQKECGSRGSVYSDTDCAESDVTSTVNSSCVIISGSTSSEGSSAYTFVDRVWPKEVVPQPHTGDINDWVATCQLGSADLRGSKSSQASHNILRRTSMSSTASYRILDAGVVPTPNEWLCSQSKRSTASIHSVCRSDKSSWLLLPSQQLANTSTLPKDCEDWLNKADECVPLAATTTPLATGDWCRKDSYSASAHDDWMSNSSAICEQELVDDDWLQQEKQREGSDWCSKEEHCGDKSKEIGDWLAEEKMDISNRSTKLMEIDDWLTGEEKMDVPKKRITNSKLDDDWLLVKGELSRIASSTRGDWLVDDNQQELTNTFLSDNRYCESTS